MRVTLAHRAEYLGLRSLVRGLGLVSFSRATSFGAHVASLGYRPLGVRRGVVERQVRTAFPEYDEREVSRVARGAYEHLGRVVAEATLLPALGKDGVLELFEGVDGWENIDAAMLAGRGLILVTGHLGNWEAAGAYLAARGIPIDVVARRMSNPLFDRYLNETRESMGMTVIYDREAVRRTAHALREGHAVAFLADQGVKHLASTYVPFFGRPAKTPRGPAVFALRWNIPIVFGTALRQASGKYRLSLEAVPVERTGDRDADVDSLVARFTEILERYVRLAPEQYFWHHRRWRRQQKPGKAKQLGTA
ncbi:MAG: lysophospholipid acyltransferase family protein [Anaerolineae bacterium]|nr:lysophospholipid acyltransferase family protein [Gemmatimonadaceae bacterium]